MNVLVETLLFLDVVRVRVNWAAIAGFLFCVGVWVAFVLAVRTAV
jgi:hypothetical protein